MFSARSRGGVIVAEDVDLPEGATVIVVADDPEDDHAELTAEEAAELEAAIAEADRGEGVAWEIVRDQNHKDAKERCSQNDRRATPHAHRDGVHHRSRPR